MAWIYAKLGDIERALEHSTIAVDAAPYCHHAHDAHAEALFLSRQFEAALAHARQAELIYPDAKREAKRWAIIGALEGEPKYIQQCEDAWAKLKLEAPANFLALARAVASGDIGPSAAAGPTDADEPARDLRDGR